MKVGCCVDSNKHHHRAGRPPEIGLADVVPEELVALPQLMKHANVGALVLRAQAVHSIEAHDQVAGDEAVSIVDAQRVVADD